MSIKDSSADSIEYNYLGIQCSASKMKVFVLLMCTVAITAASNAVAWPGAIPLSVHVKTVLPSQISGFGYSTSQYINAVPPTVLHQPQFGYQIGFPGYHPYQPVISGSYAPPTSFLYPSFAPINQAALGIPSQPPQAIPTRPSEGPAGDEDTSVIDSADFSSNQQQPSGDLQQSQLPQNPQNSFDSKNMPAIPQIPEFPAQISNLPQLPSLPQIPQPGSGSNNPDFTQLPQLPSSPFFPQSPSLPPGFPSADNSDQGLNDEDTVSIESA